MRAFFSPASAAVIGASADPNKGGHALLRNLADALAPRVYPVNPRYREIQGMPCYPNLESLPEKPDLTVIFLPPTAVEEAVAACARQGLGAVMIQSAGFAEVGEAGRAMQERCVSIARAAGMRLWGPNCIGLVDGAALRAFSFMSPDIWRPALRPGGVSIIVQSGALAGGFLMQCISEGYFGLAKACSLGNRCDVNECDILEQLALDPATEVVGMYLESLADPPRFRQAVSRLNKPIVLLKGGISQQGAKAALSHTGSLAGNAAIAEGFFRQLGIHRAYDFLELMDLTKAVYLWRGRQGGPRLAVITWSGGAGIVNADHLGPLGMTLASPSQETLERMRQVYPPWMQPANPADIWPAIERSGRPKAFGETLSALLEDPGVDAVQVHYFIQPDLLETCVQALEPARHSKKPVAVWLSGDSACFRPYREMVEPLGIPVFGEISRGARALSLLARR